MADVHLAPGATEADPLWLVRGPVPPELLVRASSKGKARLVAFRRARLAEPTARWTDFRVWKAATDD